MRHRITRSEAMAQSMTTARKKQAAETRQKIFDTAIELFDKKGYENVSIVEICEKAGVSTGAYYHHFSAKDQILLEDFLRADDVYRHSLDDIAALATYKEKMRAFTDSVMRFVKGLGLKRVKVTYHTQIGPDKEASYLSNEKRSLYSIAEELYREGQAAGEVRMDMSPEDLARLTISCYRGIIYDWCLADGAFDVVEAGMQMAEVLMQGVFSDL